MKYISIEVLSSRSHDRINILILKIYVETKSGQILSSIKRKEKLTSKKNLVFAKNDEIDIKDNASTIYYWHRYWTPLFLISSSWSFLHAVVWLCYKIKHHFWFETLPFSYWGIWTDHPPKVHFIIYVENIHIYFWHAHIWFGNFLKILLYGDQLWLVIFQHNPSSNF